MLTSRNTPPTSLGLAGRDLEKYSLASAVAYVVDPKGQADRAKHEKDISDEIAKARNDTTEGIFVPREIFDRRSLNPLGYPEPSHRLTRQAIFNEPPPRVLSRHDQIALAHRALQTGTEAQGGALVETELGTLIEALVRSSIALQNIPTIDAVGDPVEIPGFSGKFYETTDLGNFTFTTSTPTGSQFGITGSSPNEKLKFGTAPTDVSKFVAGAHLLAKSGDTEIEIPLSGAYDNSTGVTVGARTGGTLVAGAYTLTLRVPVKAAAWTGETGDAPVQDPAFTLRSFTSHFLRCMVKVSRTLILQAEGVIVENFIRNDMSIAMGTEVDRAVMVGSGASNQPRGLEHIAGVNTQSLGSDPFLASLKAQAAIGRNNHPMNNLLWIIGWELCEAFKMAKKHSNSRLRVLEEDGLINGIPVEVTSQLAGKTGFLGNWVEAALCLWQDLEILLDTETLLHQGITRIFGFMHLDFNALRPNGFTYISS